MQVEEWEEADGDVGLQTKHAPDLLEAVSDLLRELLRKKVLKVDKDGGSRPDFLKYLPNKLDWKATHVLCNLYRDRHDQVGAHSDRMTAIGPYAIILSLSLGAPRIFRFGYGSVTGSEPVYSVTLKHNDLLIMWPPMQEVLCPRLAVTYDEVFAARVLATPCILSLRYWFCRNGGTRFPLVLLQPRIG